MNFRSSRFRVFAVCAAIILLSSSVVCADQTEQASGKANNSLLAELAQAQFVEHTPDEVEKEIDGKLVGLYFTAKWCVACRAFTPKLVQLRNENPDKFQFVMVSWDRSLKDEKEYLAKAKMNAPAVRFDDPLVERYRNRYRIEGIPTLIVFDQNGKLVTTNGWGCISWTLRPGTLERELKGSEAALAWRKLVTPFQEKLQAKRDAGFASMKTVLEEYKDFPHINEIADWVGYYGGSQAINAIMRKTGKEMAADWDNQKKHLDDLPNLATRLKPQSKGYRGPLEAQAAYGLFQELGKASAKNPEILAKINAFVTAKGADPMRNGLQRKWGMIGLVAAAIEGNDKAYEQVAGWKDLGISHAPLSIYPILYPACKKGNERAVELARDIYVNDPYYVYKALPAFYAPALEGNAVAIDALGLIAAKPDQNKHDQYAVQALQAAAEKGHAKAKEVLANLKGYKKGESATPEESKTSPKKDSSASLPKADKEFGEKTASDCYILLDGKLSPIPKNSFAKTRLYVVYYSHTDCSGCAPVTSTINMWRADAAPRAEVSLIFATRGDDTNDKLVRYLQKSKIVYPAIDSMHYRRRDGENPHPFYADADDGVPFVRMFDGSGQRIDLRKHGVKDMYNAQSIADSLDAVIKSVLN
jgi:nucleoredoxin